MYLMIIHIFPLVGQAVHLLILWNVISLMGPFSVSIKKANIFQICFFMRCKFVGEGLLTNTSKIEPPRIQHVMTPQYL